MNKVVIDISCGECFGGSADVALFKEIYIHFLGKQSPYSDVKFTIVNQERFFYIFLYDK